MSEIYLLQVPNSMGLDAIFPCKTLKRVHKIVLQIYRRSVKEGKVVPFKEASERAKRAGVVEYAFAQLGANVWKAKVLP